MRRAGDAFEHAHGEIGTYRAFGALLGKGLAAITDKHSPRAERLRETREFYRFMEREWPQLVDRFQREYRKGERHG